MIGCGGWGRVRRVAFLVWAAILSLLFGITFSRFDPQMPPACAVELAHGIPDARLVVFERSGHYPFVEEPDDFWASIGSFLAENTEPAVRPVSHDDVPPSGVSTPHRPSAEAHRIEAAPAQPSASHPRSRRKAMRTLLVYDSQFGNTAQIAQAVAAALETGGPVRLVAATEATALDPADADLLVVGGPTQRHGISPALRALLDAPPRHALDGVAAATFDTRYHQARWLTGSAAGGIARVLRRKGAHLVALPESFFIERDAPPRGEKRRHAIEHLEAGELERARTWAEHLTGT